MTAHDHDRIIRRYELARADGLAQLAELLTSVAATLSRLRVDRDVPILAPGKIDRERRAELDRLTWDEWLTTPEWRTIRAEKLRIDGALCTLNHDHAGPFHVHHATYGRARGGETLRDLAVLCGECHARFHRVP